MSDLKIGSRIRELREAEKLTQEELSERANIANRALQRLESDQNSPNLDTLVQVAKALGVSLVELFEPRPPPAPAIEAQVIEAIERGVAQTLSKDLSPDKQRLVSLISLLDDKSVLDILRTVERLVPNESKNRARSSR